MLELRTFGIEGLDVPDCDRDVSRKLLKKQEQIEKRKKGKDLNSLISAYS